MKLLDPICDMVVVVEEAREAGLTLELPDREYAFCSANCLKTFAKQPERYRAKVDAWLATPHEEPHAHHDGEPVIDQGMREWYKACRCCLSETYPKVAEALDAEKAASA